MKLSSSKTGLPAMKQDEHLYKKLLGSLPDSILLLDDKNVIHYANKLAEDLLSKPGKSLLGENFGIPFVEGEWADVEYLTSRGLLIGEMRASNLDIDGLHYTLVSLRDITERQQLRDKYKSVLMSTITTLSKTLEVRDPYTVGHESRVADLSVKIAEKLGKDDFFIQGIYISALLHDIGKISVPVDILTKPGHIVDEERNLIKTHARVGYEILSNIEFPWPVANVAHQHHERLDGSGYPLGLKGGQIILEAQIVAVADVAEAVMNDRPYRKGQGVDKALEIIAIESGSKLNAEACAACIELFSKEGYSFRAY